ncbi:MAG: ATP-grasp domain-containing protein [Planctomycetota bacterium]
MSHEGAAVRLARTLAASRGWQIDIEPETHFAARLTIGHRTHVVVGADLGLNAAAAARVARDKLFVQRFLARDGVQIVPTRRVEVVADVSDLPAVLKPNRSLGGQGVSLVRDAAEVPEAIERARQHDDIVIAQPVIDLPEYRLLVVEGRVLFASRREAQPGAAAANLQQGGTWSDCTDDVHPDSARLARDLASSLGLVVAGIDLFARDIGVFDREHAVLEVNATPGLKAVSTLPQRLARLTEAVGDAIERRLEASSSDAATITSSGS